MRKADLLSDHFDSKQSREAVDLLFICHLSPNLTTIALIKVKRGQASLVGLGLL